MPKGDHFVDFVWLKNLQARTGLQLATCDQPMGLVHVDGQPAAFVAELIRLAEIGQKLEIATAVAIAASDAEHPTLKSSMPVMRSPAPPWPGTVREMNEEAVARAHVAWMRALGEMPDSVEVIMTTDQARAALKAAIEAALLWMQPGQ